jgi:hypothetical protein
MRLYLTNQLNNFDRLLEDLIATPAMTFDKPSLKEKVTTISLNTKKTIDQLNLDFLFSYRIFPSHILTYRTQWAPRNRKMQIGDTILQQVFIPPIKGFSLKIVFGVRVHTIINEARRKGFGYVTLEGHVEKGESIFAIEENVAGLVFKITTFSAPGNLLTRLMAPIFSVPYQAYCTRKALENVKKQIEN